jgi:membrane protein required for colicin V production
MDGFTLIDAIVAGVIVLSAILAYSRGLVREAMAIAGWIGAAVLAFVFAPSVQPLVKELPVVGSFLGDSCELSIIGAFALVFAVGLVIAALFTPLFSSAVQRSALGGIDQALGFLFGVARGIILVAVAFIVYDRAVAANTVVDASRSAKVFASFQTNIDASIPADAPGWIVDRYTDLTAVCVAPAAPADATTPPAGN